MADQESFFSTTVGARRGVPPLRLQRCLSAKTRKPMPSPGGIMHVLPVKKELDIMQEEIVYSSNRFSENSNHARLVL